MKSFLVFVSSAVLSCIPQLSAHQVSPLPDQSCAHYLGNEGVMISSGETKILFDAFYAQSYGQYALVPAATRKALIESSAPFDDVDALFVSHVHGDHFSPAPTLEYLRANPKVKLYASGQVVDTLAGSEQQLAQRLVAFDLATGDPAQSLTVGSISIDVVRIPHSGAGRENIENLAFRVSLDNQLTVLHLGDAGFDERVFAAHQNHWAAKKLDVAFPPYWFLTDATGRAILDTWLKPEKTIGIHVPIAAAGNGDAWRIEYGGDLFTDPGETRALSEAGCAEQNPAQ